MLPEDTWRKGHRSSVIADAADNCFLAAVPVVYGEGSETFVSTCPTVVTKMYRVLDAASNSRSVYQTTTFEAVTALVLTGQGVAVPVTCELTFKAPTATTSVMPVR